MSKTAQKYFYILVILLNGICSFANSNVFSNTSFTYNDNNCSIIEQTKDTQFKQINTNLEELKKSIEISESEIEEEEKIKITTSNNFNFFDTYFNTEICANFKHLVQNRLAPCKHKDYLSSILSLYISFCDFRI